MQTPTAKEPASQLKSLPKPQNLEKEYNKSESREKKGQPLMTPSQLHLGTLSALATTPQVRQYLKVLFSNVSLVGSACCLQNSCEEEHSYREASRYGDQGRSTLWKPDLMLVNCSFVPIQKRATSTTQKLYRTGLCRERDILPTMRI